MINFHWRPALHYHVSPPNYICINDVRHYYRGLGRHWRGERGSCAVWGGKGVLKGHWHRWCAFLFFFPLLVMTHKSAEETRLSSAERVRVVGFRPSEVSKKEASIDNIKSPSLNNHRREWLSGSSSPQTEESLLRQTISLWPIVWDQWKINLSHFDNVRQT